MPRDPETGRYWLEHDGEAAWALAKLGAAEHAAAQIKARRREADQRTKLWADTESKGPNRDAAFFEGLLVDWAVRQVPADLLDPAKLDTAEGRKRWEKYSGKSQRFPTGKVSARFNAGSYTVTDPAAWTAFVLETLPAPERAALKDLTDHAAAVAALVPMLSSVVALGQFVASPPPPDHGSFAHPADMDGRVVYVGGDPHGAAVGEIVPGLRWSPAYISWSCTPDKGEHPGWNPAPAGSDLPDDAPIVDEWLVVEPTPVNTAGTFAVAP